jgi:hypothetical protein
MPCLELLSLKRLDAFHTSPVSTISLSQRIYLRKVQRRYSRMLTFTTGNTKTQLTETKHVSNRKLGATPQLPFGDDVSAIHPLHRSVPFAVAYAEVDETCRRTGRASP